MRRRTFLGLSLFLAGCAELPGGPGRDDPAASVPRPEWRVGDRWVFQRVTGARAPVIVAHEVVAAGPDGYRERIGGPGDPGPAVIREWTRDLQLRGQGLGAADVSFEPPAAYFSWPLTLGKTWSQDLEVRGGPRPGHYAATWQVGSTVERIDVPAGSFYTVRIEHAGAGGQRLATYWYTPLVRYWARYESYTDGYSEDLVEWRPWA